jgi:hypothetical protein
MKTIEYKVKVKVNQRKMNRRQTLCCDFSDKKKMKLNEIIEKKKIH